MTSRDEAEKEAKKIVELYFGLRPNWIDNTPMYDLILSSLLRKEKDAWNKAIEAAKMVSLKYGEDTGNEYEPTAIANEIEKLRRKE